MPLTCPHCGGQAPDDARYCPGCGAVLDGGEEERGAGNGAPAAAVEQPGLAGEATPSGEPPDRDARNFAMLCHLASFVGFVGIPFGNIIGPLVVWLVKRDESPFIDYHGKQSLNFQISLTIYLIISAVLILVLVGLLLIIGLFFLGVITVIVGAVRAANGEEFSYPLTIRFLR